MKKIRNHPVGTLLLLVVFYAIFLSSSWSGIGLINKTSSLIVIIGSLLHIFLIRFSWPVKYNTLKKKLVSRLLIDKKSISFRKILNYIIASSLLVFVVTIIEYLVTLIFFGTPVYVGYPYPIYSFSVYRFLVFGYLMDVILYSLLLNLIINIFLKDQQKL